MKIDLSNPVVRNLVEYFSAGMKKFRDQNKKLKRDNAALETKLLHTRCITLDIIMEKHNCSYEMAEHILGGRIDHRFQTKAKAAVN